MGKHRKKISRINWDALKIEFMKDPKETSVSEFLRFKLEGMIQAKKIPTAYHRKKAKGWGEEKEKYWREIKHEIYLEEKKKLKKQHKIDPADLDRDHKRVMDIIAYMLSTSLITEKDKKTGKNKVIGVAIKPKDLRHLYSMIKNEKGEPDRTLRKELKHEVDDLDEFLKQLTKKVPNAYEPQKST